MAMNHVREGLPVLGGHGKLTARGWKRLSVAGLSACALALGALCVAPTEAYAQPKKGVKADPKKDPKKDPKAGGKADIDADAEEKKVGGEGAGAGEGEGPKESGEGEGPEPPKPDDDKPPICKIDPDLCNQTLDIPTLAKKPLNPEMYAVQQIYALRKQRFEMAPYFGVTLNDQFVSHPGPGISLNYYITNVIAVGVNGNFYFGLNGVSSFNAQTSRAARVGLPITEYQWNANANFTYVPAYGKFAGFGDFIFHYDFYLIGGVGAISTRPYAVVDPDNRVFDFVPKVSFSVGGGLRIFFNRWFSLVLEMRDYMFFDELENPSIALGFNPATGQLNAQDPATWKADGTSFTNNVQAQIGLSIFLPPTWEYKLPK